MNSLWNLIGIFISWQCCGGAGGENWWVFQIFWGLYKFSFVFEDFSLNFREFSIEIFTSHRLQQDHLNENRSKLCSSSNSSFPQTIENEKLPRKSRKIIEFFISKPSKFITQSRKVFLSSPQYFNFPSIFPASSHFPANIFPENDCNENANFPRECLFAAFSPQISRISKGKMMFVASFNGRKFRYFSETRNDFPRQEKWGKISKKNLCCCAYVH
jgi:hypothetical protein